MPGVKPLIDRVCIKIPTRLVSVKLGNQARVGPKPNMTEGPFFSKPGKWQLGAGVINFFSLWENEEPT